MELKFNASQKKSFVLTYAVFFLNGLMALSIGSLMPYLREARGLDYVFCGFLVSIHSVGNLASSFLAGMLPMAIGRKKSILVFNILYPIAYLLNRGCEVAEVQVKMDERIAGTSYLGFVSSIQYMIRICLSILFIQWFRKRG